MDPTFWAFVALLILLGLGFLLKVPEKIFNILDARRQKISLDLEEARFLREEAQKLLLEFQKKRKETEQEASEIIEMAKTEAENILKDARKKTQSFVLRHMNLAEKKIQLAENAAIQEIKETIIDKAIEQVKKTLL